MSSPRTPGLLWKAFVVLGGGTVVAVAYSDTAWEKWEGVAGDAIPRDVFKKVAVGSMGLHVAEAFGAYFAARRAKLDSPMRWAFASLIWGFPVHRRLTNERRRLKKSLKGRALDTKDKTVDKVLDTKDKTVDKVLDAKDKVVETTDKVIDSIKH